MPLSHYHLFVGRYERGLMAPDANHFEIKLNTGGDFYRVAVNVRSQDGSMLMTLVDNDFRHELCSRLLAEFTQQGVYDIGQAVKRKQFGLDFLRRNMVGDFNKMMPLPNNAPGLDNDLEDKLRLALEKSNADPNSLIFVFGEKWPSTPGNDRYFPEIRDQGIHDIHMNQGNPPGRFERDNGVFQDGGILIYYPSLNRWTAILLAFQSQFNSLNPTTLHTDDTTGNRINVSGGTTPADTPSVLEQDVVIVGALVNPRGDEDGKEKVILLNTTENDIELSGWKLVDRNRNEFTITNVNLSAGGTTDIRISRGSVFKLGNNGGTISLLNGDNIKVAGVQYTKEQASKEGRVISF